MNQFLSAPGSSVLLQELANAQTSPDSTISAHSMPLLHGLSAVHSCINVFTHICKVGQVCILIRLCIRLCNRALFCVAVNVINSSFALDYLFMHLCLEVMFFIVASDIVTMLMTSGL